MEIKVENHLGDTLILDNDFIVTNVEGLTPPGATINTSSIATVDGTFFNSSFTNERNIVLTIVPEIIDVEKARLILYRFFKPKYKIKLFFKTKYREVYIEGYGETFEGPLYEQKQSFQISIICPRPFFKDVNDNSHIQNMIANEFEFPFHIPETGLEFGTIQTSVESEILNRGEETTGLVIHMIAKAAVVEPTIYNRTTGELFTIAIEMKKGDEIIINTRVGEKKITLISNGTEKNILNKVAKNSKWFNVVSGQNMFGYKCAYGAENLIVNYTVNTLYEGV